ncbi:alpha-1,2-fucosyltransferase [Portibacter marinus]|uniref:alpha-1,2-fucosyltransferase n=1 Tax=Portibacter marinus TaxID=2898660 RepID=UPI001F1EBB7A|nr:alpha-1,2-fucosyltransferase [Portibacter marinus]
MIKVRLKGGLGNQMFQYAFGQAMAKKLSTDVKYDLSSLLNRRKQKGFVYRNYDLDVFRLEPQFDINRNIISSLHGIKNARISGLIMKYVQWQNTFFKERFFHFDQELYENPRDEVLYDGWWQSHRYFDAIEDDLRADFTFREKVIDHSTKLYHDIIDSNSICLNVRRTDFLKNEVLNATDLSYFKKGVKFMQENVDSPSFFIFSDDINWCRENFGFLDKNTIVDHSHKGKKFENYLNLMKSCKHFIIPNSSFAYWAAYLSNYSNKIVVAPKKWFTDDSIITDDLVHKDWIRL